MHGLICPCDLIDNKIDMYIRYIAGLQLNLVRRKKTKYEMQSLQNHVYGSTSLIIWDYIDFKSEKLQIDLLNQHRK